MILEIFNVEHGQCSLFTSNQQERVLVDAGHNSSTGWSPSKMLRARRVEQLEFFCLSNIDEDHASDLHNVRATVGISCFAKNPTVGAGDVLEIKAMPGVGILSAVDMLRTYTGPGFALDYDGLTKRQFYNSYPHDFEDENNLSSVFIFQRGGTSICFPGDMERPGWLRLLNDPNFRSAMSDVDIFIASHHGRQSGVCAELFEQTGLNPVITIVSDGGKMYSTQETRDFYASRTQGIMLDGRHRQVLTTRADGNIGIDLDAGIISTF